MASRTTGRGSISRNIMQLGNPKADADGIFMGRIATVAFGTTIALRPVLSSGGKASACDMMALSADRRQWIGRGRTGFVYRSCARCGGLRPSAGWMMRSPCEN